MRRSVRALKYGGARGGDGRGTSKLLTARDLRRSETRGEEEAAARRPAPPPDDERVGPATLDFWQMREQLRVFVGLSLDVFGPMMIGGLVVGGICTAISYPLTVRVVKTLTRSN